MLLQRRKKIQRKLEIEEDKISSCTGLAVTWTAKESLGVKYRELLFSFLEIGNTFPIKELERGPTGTTTLDLLPSVKQILTSIDNLTKPLKKD